MSKERKRNNSIFLLSIIIYTLVYFIFIVRFIPNFAATLNGIFISILTFLAFQVYGFQKIDVTKLRKKIIIQTIVAIFIYFTIIYGLGFFTGFVRNSYSLKILAIIKHIIIPLAIIISMEMFRYIFISSNKDSTLWIVLITIAMIIFDVGVNFRFIEPTSLKIFIFISVTIIPLIFKNIVLTYLTYQIGYHPCLIYVLPLVLYNYFVPILPNLGDYLTCVLGIILPAMLFLYSSRTINDFLRGKESKYKIIRIILLDIPLIVIFSLGIGFISGYFKYHLIGVNTSVISPKVNRGDAIMIDKEFKIEDINVGDVIAYQNEGKIIVDIVSEKVDDKVYLKAVKESETDYSYTILKKDDIMGIYKFRIEKIAYPTIWFKEFIKG